MTQLHGWKEACTALLLFAVTAIAASAQTFNTLVTFDGPNGSTPFAPLTQGLDGSLYGTTFAGGNYSVCNSGCGTAFEITLEGRLTTLANFCNETNCADGDAPFAGLVLATNGEFYGTASGGGAYNGYGTVFKITPGGTLTTLYSFCGKTNCPDGRNPQAGLIQAVDGNFYGTTGGVISGNAGTVFQITPAGKLTTLYSFCSKPNCTDGANPEAGLIQATDGNFYGTTSFGGASNLGTVFRITPKGVLTTLHQFSGGDGEGPEGGLVLAVNGDFYGTTEGGGANGWGTVFKITPGGTLTTVHSFCSQAGCADGVYPSGALVTATDGNLYGTTQDGGGTKCANGCGTVFRITLGGSLTTLHTFENTDGAQPYGGLVQATNGNFYGTTFNGGDLTCNPDDGCGTVFGLSAGLGPFVAFVRGAAKVGESFGVLGQGFTGTTSVSLNGTPASFTVKSDTLLIAAVPAGATTGYVTVATPSGMLTSNVSFYVIP